MQQEAFTAAEKAVATIQALVVIGRIQSCDLDLNVTLDGYVQVVW